MYEFQHVDVCVNNVIRTVVKNWLQILIRWPIDFADRTMSKQQQRSHLRIIGTRDSIGPIIKNFPCVSKSFMSRSTSSRKTRVANAIPTNCQVMIMKLLIFRAFPNRFSVNANSFFFLLKACISSIHSLRDFFFNFVCNTAVIKQNLHRHVHVYVNFGQMLSPIGQVERVTCLCWIGRCCTSPCCLFYSDELEYLKSNWICTSSQMRAVFSGDFTTISNSRVAIHLWIRM